MVRQIWSNKLPGYRDRLEQQAAERAARRAAERAAERAALSEGDEDLWERAFGFDQLMLPAGYPNVSDEELWRLMGMRSIFPKS